MNVIGVSGEGVKCLWSEQVVFVEQWFEIFLVLLGDILVLFVLGKVMLKLLVIVLVDIFFCDVIVVVEFNGIGWKFDQVLVELLGCIKVEVSGLFDFFEKWFFKGMLLVVFSQFFGLLVWIVGDVVLQICNFNVFGFFVDVLIDDDVQQFDNFELVVGGVILKGCVECWVFDGGGFVLFFFNLFGGDFDVDVMCVVVSFVIGKDIVVVFLVQIVLVDLQFCNLVL